MTQPTDTRRALPQPSPALRLGTPGAMRFYLTTHKRHWIKLTDVPLFLKSEHFDRAIKWDEARGPYAIDSGGFMVARLFLESREQVAEFDASTEEVAQMIMHLQTQGDASDPQWDRALAGHSAAERAAARVYVLDI